MNTIHRRNRKVAAGVVAATALLALVGCSTPAQNDSPSDVPQVTLKFGALPPGGGTWPVLAADDQGYFADQGITLDTTYGTPDLVTQALATGNVDIALVSSAFVTYPREDTVLVAVGDAVAIAPEFLLASNSIKTVADLKGKRVAIGQDTDAQNEIFEQIIKKAGLTLDDLEIYRMPTSALRSQALINGVVDAALVLPPQDGAVLAAGAHELSFFPDAGFPEPTLSSLAVRRAWAEEHADLVRRFFVAYAQGIDWVLDPANKDAAIQLLQDKAQVEEDAAESAYNAYIVRAKAYPVGGCIRTEGLDVLIDFMKKNGFMPDASAKLTGADFTDTSYCPTSW